MRTKLAKFASVPILPLVFMFAIQIPDAMAAGIDCTTEPTTYGGFSMDEVFGPGANELTRCLSRTKSVKVVVQINRFCKDNVPDSECTRPYALGSIRNMMHDYEDNHDMQSLKDFQIVAVLHSGGVGLALTDEGFDGNGDWVSGRNQFQSQVETLMGQGVRIYVGQFSVAGFIAAGRLPEAETVGGATGELIPGIEYATNGSTAIADFQKLGFVLVQP